MRTLPWPFLFFMTLFYSCSTTPQYVVIDGILEIPENRKNTNSRTLKLAYKVLKAKNADSKKAPIVFLQGGPGGATLIMEPFWENNPLRNDRDIILMDQRGTGISEANCIDMGKTMFSIARQDLDFEEEINAIKTILSECKETMKHDEVDLAGYTSAENAADFEDLRKTLGYKQWNLFGVSYGSRLGLTIIRDFPEGIQSAVLAGILAPETNYINNASGNFESSLFNILNRCKENKNCNDRYPNLKARLLKMLKKLQSEPLHFEYKEEPFILNSQDALAILFVSLYDRYSIGNIPLLIDAMENEEKQSLIEALKGIEYMYSLVNWPMNFSVMTYEEFPFYDEIALVESLKRSEALFNLPLSTNSGMELMNDWHAHRASELENQPVVSEIPTLMASGALDHITPSSNAVGALKHLKNGYELIFPDESHNLFNPCFFQITEDFFNDPFHTPDMQCSTTRHPIEWNLVSPVQ